MSATLLRAIDADGKKRWIIIAGGMAETGRPEESVRQLMEAFRFRHGFRPGNPTRIKGVLNAGEACDKIDELMVASASGFLRSKMEGQGRFQLTAPVSSEASE